MLKNSLIHGLVIFVFLSLANSVLAEQIGNGSLLVIPEVAQAAGTAPGIDPEGGAILQNFLLLGSSSGPKEITRLKISYGKSQLYVSGEVSSFALDSASNMDDSFLAKAVERDGKVTADDSVEIRIQNKRGESFSVAINALGTVLDMRYDAHQDMGWNGKISAQAERAEGCWRFQMAISLASLGLSDLSRGDTLLFNAIRRDSLNGEISLLDPDMMTLVLGGSSPFAEVSHFEQPLSSGTQIPVTVVNASGQTVAWKRETLQGAKVVTSAGGSGLASDDQWEENTASSSEKAPLARRERISVYASGHLIYRSPEFPFQDSRSEVQISARADVPFTLSWNGEELAAGGQAVDNIVAGLVYGTNELTLRMASGHSPTVEIIGPGGILLEANEAWDEIQSPEGESVFQKTIAYQATSLSPHFPDGIAELAAGNAQFFHWDGGDLKAWDSEAPLENFRLILEVPEGLHFVGASGYQPRESAATEAGLRPVPEVAEYTWSKLGDVKRGEVNYERYVISRNLPVFLSAKPETWLEGEERRQNGMAFAIRSDPNRESGTFSPMFYGMEADEGTIVEIPNSMIFEARPPLNGEAQQEIVLSYYSRLGLIKDQKLSETYFETLKSAGINEVLTETASDYPRKIGLRQSSFFALSQSSRVGFGMGTVMVDKILEAFPESQAVTFSGQKRLTPCLAWLAGHEEPWPVIDEEIASIARRNPSMSHLFWDYEFPPFPEGVDAYPMFSEFGIGAFKNAYEIEGELTPEIIRDRYAEEWVAFTCGEVARVVGRLQEIAARHGMGFTMYSGYQLPYTQRRYNVDWAKLGPHLDRAYCGYSNDQALIDGTREALGETPLIGALLAQGSSSPNRSSATIVRTLIAHRGGVLFWFEGGGESARTLVPIAAASRFASTYEPFVLEGKRLEDLDGIPETDWDGVILLRRGQETLLVLLNEGNAPRRFYFDLPEGLVTETAGSGRRTIEETVEAGDFYSVLLHGIDDQN